MDAISNSDRYKLLLKAGLVLTLMISYGVYSNIDNLRWFFVDPKGYHQTVGQVLSSTVEGRGVHGGWAFNIAYRYEVGDQEFVSNRVHFGYQAMDDPSYAKSYVEKYPIGKQVVVFYDANHPENSVLEPQVVWNGLLAFYLIILLLPLTVFGLAAYFFIRSRS